MQESSRDVRKFRLASWLLSAFLFVLAWFLWPRERLLVERAVRVASVQDWNGDATPFYTWLSNQEVIFWREHTKTSDDTPLCKLNVAAGAETQIGTAPSRASLGPSTPQISPDGKRLFWFEGEDNEVREVAGSQRALLPHHAHSHVRGGDVAFWMDDSHHWLLADWGELYDRFRLRGPVYLWIGDTGAPSRAIRIPIAADSPLRLQTAQVYGSLVSSQNRMLAMQKIWRDQFVTSADVFELDPHANARLLGKRTVRFPFAVHLRDAAFSPRGDRIVWRFVYPPRSAIPAVLQRWLPFLRPPRQLCIGVWVSRTDGRDMHEVGHLVYPSDNEEALNAELAFLNEDLRWLPDGKRLSFVYRASLYTVPAD